MFLTLLHTDISLSRSFIKNLNATTKKPSVTTRLRTPLVAAALPIFDGLTHTGIAMIKLPFVGTRLTVGKLLGIDNRFPETATLRKLSLHVYRAVTFFIVAILGLVLGFVHPRAVVWLHRTADLDTFYDLPDPLTRRLAKKVLSGMRDLANRPAFRVGLTVSAMGLAAYFYYRTSQEKPIPRPKQPDIPIPFVKPLLLASPYPTSPLVPIHTSLPDYRPHVLLVLTAAMIDILPCILSQPSRSSKTTSEIETKTPAVLTEQEPLTQSVDPPTTIQPVPQQVSIETAMEPTNQKFEKIRTILENPQMTNEEEIRQKEKAACHILGKDLDQFFESEINRLTTLSKTFPVDTTQSWDIQCEQLQKQIEIERMLSDYMKMFAAKKQLEQELTDSLPEASLLEISMLTEDFQKLDDNQ